MPVVLLVVVAATIALLAVCAPRTFQRVRGKVAARIQLRDGLGVERRHATQHTCEYVTARRMAHHRRAHMG